MKFKKKTVHRRSGHSSEYIREQREQMLSLLSTQRNETNLDAIITAYKITVGGR